MTTKNETTIGMLELTNAMKDLEVQVSEGIPLEYKTIETLRGGTWLMTKHFGFAQPRCEHGHTNYYSDYMFKEDLPKEKKEKVN